MSEKLPDIKRDSFLLRIRTFFSKFFYKEVKKLEPAVKEEKVINKKVDFFAEEREKSKRHDYLLELQKKFEEGEIFESEINSTDNEELRKIYVEQITMLKVKIRSIECQM